MVARIITHMQSTAEWGQFFPMYLSGLGYNETVAQELYPLIESQALSLHGLWYKDENNKETEVKKYVPHDIADISDSITNDIYTCVQCQKGYQLIKQEIEFYQTNQLALPQKCFTCRHQARTTQRNPHRLRETHCASCQQPIQTTFSVSTKQPILCQSCFQKELY